MTAFADLEALIGPPAVTPPAVDWPALEAVTGLEFPADYKALCARYGMLEVNAFMSVLHPCVAPDITTWDRNAKDDLETLRELTEDSGVIYLLDDSGGEVEAAPYPYHPEPCGLFPWGSTENGDTLLWLTDADPGR